MYNQRQNKNRTIMSSKNYLGPATIHFKQEIPEKAKAIPRVEIIDEKTLHIPYANTVSRVRSIDFIVNGITHTLSEKTVQKVLGPKNEIIFGN